MNNRRPKTGGSPPSELSPVFARGEDAKPQVRAPNSPLTMWVGVVGACALGAMVFNGLSASRQANAQSAPPRPERPVAAPEAPAIAAPRPAPSYAVAPTGPALPVNPGIPAEDAADAHWRAPTVVVDLGGGDAAPIQLAQAQAPAPPRPVDSGTSAEERFAARLTTGSGDVARAGTLRDLGRTLPQGSVIPAVLETAIDSDLPGSVRGIVSRDVRSFDGSRVLVPRGSRLIGQYKSAAAAGQTRAFVVWTRIITPQGVTIDVASPGADRLGRGGLEGDVDTHFLRRFGGSILLTIIGAGSQALANGASGGDTVIIGTGQANSAAAAALQKQMDIPDTIRVPHGAPVQVFVARDLDFSGVIP